MLTLPSKQPGELRHLAIGLIDGRYWTVIYAPRGDTLRLISARRSRLHEKNSSKNSLRESTTAANLEARFESGRTVLDYFDPARAVLTHGGARAGAGRKALGKLPKTVKLSPAAIRRFEAYARRKKLPHFSAALEAASRLL